MTGKKERSEQISLAAAHINKQDLLMVKANQTWSDERLLQTRSDSRFKHGNLITGTVSVSFLLAFRLSVRQRCLMLSWRLTDLSEVHVFDSSVCSLN